MTINELCKEAYANATEAGWYDKEIEMGTRLMLIVSEISEAMEADRKGRYKNASIWDLQYMNDILNHMCSDDSCEFGKDAFESGIKDTFEDELADTVIRIADLCGRYGIDLEEHIKLKMQYNKTRGYKHGGKKY